MKTDHKSCTLLTVTDDVDFLDTRKLLKFFRNVTFEVFSCTFKPIRYPTGSESATKPSNFS